MATKELITKVWIEPGCIVCDACETAAPTVFEVLEETCIVRPEALNAEFTKPLTEAIGEAAEECPVDVIKFETTGVEVSAQEPVATTADTKKSASPEAPASEADAAIAALSSKTVPEAPKGPVDPAIHALLQAVTARGGSGIVVGSTSNARAALDSLGKKTFDELPPDARYTRVLESSRELKKADPGAKGVSRREFVNKAVLTIGWASLGGTIAVSAGPAFGRFMMPNVLEEPDPRVKK